MRKIILDTNVPLYDPEIISECRDSEIIIPVVVLDELDAKKIKESEVGRNARKFIRYLDELRKIGTLHKGISLSNGSIVRIALSPEMIPNGLCEKVDNKILATAIAENAKGQKVTVITKDINLRVKCDALNICAEDYRKSDVNDLLDIYNGYKTIESDKESIDKIYSGDAISAPENGELINNQFVILRSEKKSVLGIHKFGFIEKVKDYVNIFNVNPKNKEQIFALNLLFDPDIKLVTLTGTAGSGKTLLSLAAGLQQTIKNKDYIRLVISKPNQPMGGKERDLGFLPGSIAEKMEPWLAPFKDNLEFICGPNEYEKQVADGTITIEALTYMRGRSIPNSFIIVDECQNLMPKEIKSIVTRVGYGSKLVLLGDITQIDNIFLDFATNGLTAAIESFKGNKIFGHVTLTKGERSELATLASQIL